MFKQVLRIVMKMPFLFLIMHTIVRIIRHFHKFPIPSFLANAIDNPMRRKFMPPDQTALRYGIRAGMTVLEVGPGNGRYTAAAARRVGVNGKIIAIDIEPDMIERVNSRSRSEGISNIIAETADVYNLPYENASFDLITLTTVIGEIPEPQKAMVEFHRVLKPEGILVFSELLFDPDYPLAQNLIRLAQNAGFHLKRKLGNFFYYTLHLTKTKQDIDPSLVSRVNRPREAAMKSYDNISGWYDLLVGKSEWRLTRGGLELLKIQPGEQILEIGFGTGHSIIYLANLVGATGMVYGVDISSEMLEKTQKRVNRAGMGAQVELTQCDALDLPFDEDQMDALFLSFTLELFDTPDIPVLLEECRRVLKPGGRIGVVSMAKRSHDNIAVKAYELAHEKWPVLIDCRPIFTAHTLETSGFEIKVHRYQSTWGLPVDIILAENQN